MTTTAQAFDQFKVDIAPTDYQVKTLIPARQRNVVENLTNAFPATSDLPFMQAYLIGSAAKGTVIRPIDDVDVLAVFSNAKKAWDKYRANSQDFLYRIRRAYDGTQIQQVGARGQAVRVFFNGGGHVDVAPVFWRGDDDYHLPNGTGGWLLTSPMKANKWFADENARLAHNLKPLVRLLKQWNRAHSSRLKSFHLETMTAGIFKSLSTNNSRENLQRFFEWAPNHIDVIDPGGHSGVLSSYLTTQGRADVINSFAAAKTRAASARLAEAAGDHAEAKRLWAIVLGAAFPTA